MDATPISIAYEGDAKQTAERLRALLSTNQAPVPEAEDISPGTELGGMGHLILTFVATTLGKAFSKSAVAQLRAFLRERIDANDRKLQLSVDVKGKGSRRLMFSLEKASLETADVFCEQLEKLIEALL